MLLRETFALVGNSRQMTFSDAGMTARCRLTTLLHASWDIFDVALDSHRVTFTYWMLDRLLLHTFTRALHVIIVVSFVTGALAFM